MSPYEKIHLLITAFDFINHPKCFKAFENILLGKLTKSLLPANLQFLFEIWNNLDLVDKEVKHCIEMIDQSRK